MAVIQDPQGATFIASQFVPENKDLKAVGEPGTGSASAGMWSPWRWTIFQPSGSRR